jgi:hypothetical protein
MIEDLVLEDILKKPENRNLVWNNYFEPIGEAREYQGQWISMLEWTLTNQEGNEVKIN